jgi:hypothetical protein
MALKLMKDIIKHLFAMGQPRMPDEVIQFHLERILALRIQLRAELRELKRRETDFRYN